MPSRPVSFPPPAAVREAWRVDALEPIDGGQETAFAGDGLVLKPVVDLRQHEWLAAVLDGLPRVDDLRVIRPRPASDGRWAVEGWAAWEFMEGEVDRGRWREALGVSDRFHGVVSSVGRSPTVPGHHPWATGDAFSWGEVDIAFPDRFRPLVDRLTGLREAIEGIPRQFVHGDLGGNILFHPRLPPAVIDVSPYWRPKRYADAIVVADAIAWGGADLRALEPLRDPVGVQMMARAVLFRIGAAAITFAGHEKRLGVEIAAFHPIVQALGAA